MSQSPSAGTETYEGRDLEAMDFADRYHRWIRDEFRPFLAGHVVEVGAGTGAFTELLLEMPEVARVSALEPAVAMYERLVQRIGQNGRVRPLRSLFRDLEGGGAPLDAAVYVNVLEHIGDDEGELRAAAERLRPGSHLCIFVPALRWLYSDFDASIGHHRRYTKAELEAKVRRAGFDVVLSRYFDLAGVLPWLIVYRVLRRPMVRGQVAMYDRYVVPIARRVERMMRPPLGKNVLLVARRR